MHKCSLLLPIALIVAALPFSGCGGGNGGGETGVSETGATTTRARGGSDEDQITHVIKITSTTSKASNCTELETQRFAKQIYLGANGRNGVAICRLSGPESSAKSVTISNVEVNGDKATAEVAVTGAAFDGQTLVVSLVREGGQWKMDHLDDFIDFDASRFAEAFAKTHEKAADLRGSQVPCVTRSLDSLAPDKLKALIISGEPRPFAAPYRDCLK